MQKTFYAKDFTEGQIFELGKKSITRDEIIIFSKKYDPFPFHIDDDAASNTIFGTIISSDCKTVLIWLGMMH